MGNKVDSKWLLDSEKVFKNANVCVGMCLGEGGGGGGWHDIHAIGISGNFSCTILRKVEFWEVLYTHLLYTSFAEIANSIEI